MSSVSGDAVRVGQEETYKSNSFFIYTQNQIQTVKITTTTTRNKINIKLFFIAEI